MRSFFNEGDSSKKVEPQITKTNDHPSALVLDYFMSLGFTKYDREDKSAWQFYIQHDGSTFCLREWKFSQWSIDVAWRLFLT